MTEFERLRGDFGEQQQEPTEYERLRGDINIDWGELQGYQQQPQNISDLPDYEKLTRSERWLMRKLPGFADSGVGKALIRFNDSWPGKALQLLDVAAEGLERVVGLGAQWVDAWGNPDKMSSFTGNMKEAWQASSLTSDFARVPIYKDGRWQITQDLPGIGGVVEARQRLIAGESLEEVQASMYDDLGTLAIRAQKQDAIQHIIADPLWVISKYVKPIEMLKLASIKRATQVGLPAAVAEQAELMGRLGKIAGKIDETADLGSELNRLEKFAKSADEIADIKKMRGIVDSLSGLRTPKPKTKIGLLDEIDETLKAVENMTLMSPWEQKIHQFLGTTMGFDKPWAELGTWQRAWRRFSPLAQTPKARAHHLINLFQQNFSAYILAKSDDPAHIMALLRRMIDGTTGPELGHMIVSAEGRMLRGIMMEWGATGQDLLSAWEKTAAFERPMLDVLSQTLGEHIPDIMKQIRNGESVQVLQRFMDVLGSLDPRVEAKFAELLAARGYQSLTSEMLDGIGHVFKDVDLYTVDIFKSMLHNHMMDSLAQMSIIHFGVTADKFIQKLAGTVKSAETLAYLKLNPAYPIKNLVNNVATSISRGVFGVVSPVEIEKFFDDILGFLPPRLQEAFSPAELAAETVSKTEDLLTRGAKTASNLLSDAKRGESGMLDKITDTLNSFGFGDKKWSFGKWAQEIERKSGMQAMYQSFKRHWGQTARIGKGYDSFDTWAGKSADIVAGDVKTTVQRAVESAQNEAGLRAAVTSDNLNINMSNVLRTAETKLGIDDLDNVLGADFIASIEDRLLEAIHKGDGAIDDVFASIHGEVKEKIAKSIEQDFDNMLDELEALGTAAGPGAFAPTWASLQDEQYATHFRHALDTNRIAEDIRKGTDPAIANLRWRHYFAESKEYYGRFWIRQEAKFKKLAKVVPGGEGKIILEHFREVRRSWKGFFKKRERLWNAYSDAKIAGKVPRKATEAIRDELDEAYEAAWRLEDQITRQIDDTLSGMYPDQAQKDLYMATRQKIADLRRDDKVLVGEFRKNLRDASPDAIEGMYQKFTQQRLARHGMIWLEERRAMAALEGNAEAVRHYDDLIQKIRTTRAEEVLDIETLNARFGIPDQGGDIFRKSVEEFDPDGFIKDTMESLGQHGGGASLNSAEYKKIAANLKKKDPTAYAIWDWVANNGKEGKLRFIEYMKSNPEEAEKIQAVTRWAVENKYGTSVALSEGKIMLSRSIGPDEGVIRPWESMTLDDDIAMKWKSFHKRKGPVLKYEVPAENIFTTFETHPAMDWLSGEKEFILNARGLDNARLISVDGVPATAADIAKYGGKDLPFITDFHSLVEKNLPFGVGLEQLRYNRQAPALDALQDSAKEVSKSAPLKFKDLSPEGQKLVNGYLRHAEGQMSDIRLASMKMGEYGRDSALLNYNRRTNFDTWLGTIVPYEFWMTHTAWNWALHSIDRPAAAATFLRLKKFIDTGFRPESGFPSRLKGHIRIKVPFLPDWMGDEVFINPMNAMLPIDNFTRPYEQYMAQERRDEGVAERVLEELWNDGQISQDDYIQALQTHSGPVWNRAVTLARQDNTEERQSTWDFASMLLSPHAPLTWAYNAARGKDIQEGPFLPISRSIRGVAGLLGIDTNEIPGLNIGGKIRESMGLHPFDKWDDYRVNRMMVNMISLGESINGVPISIEDIKRAMVEQQGPLWEEAKRRSLQEYGVGAMGSTIGLPTKAYPPGEEASRKNYVAQKENYELAWKLYEMGDHGAVNDFLEANPEYEARLALFKKPEEQLRTFLVDQLWDTYNGYPSLNKREIREQLGDDFVRSVLTPETRSISSIPVEQIAMWIKMMGSDPIGSLGDEAIPINLAPPEIAEAAQAFYDIRLQRYPNYFELQSDYFKLDKGRARKKYLGQNPELAAYWNWRGEFLTRNPTIAPYLSDKPPTYQSIEQIEQFQAVSLDEWRRRLGSATFNQVLDFVVDGDMLDDFAIDRIEALGFTVDAVIQQIAQASGL